MKPRYILVVLAMLAVLVPSAWAAARFKILHNFGPSKGIDGSYPYGPPFLDSTGSLYGVTHNGGGSGCGGAGCGTVFELSPQGDGRWGEQILHSFQDSGDGAFPVGNLVQGGYGDLYGTDSTYEWKPSGMFQLMPGSGGWTLSLIWTQGTSPGLLLDAAGDLYGFFSKDFQGVIGELSPTSLQSGKERCRSQIEALP